MKLKLSKHKFWARYKYFSTIEVLNYRIEEWGKQENLDLKKEGKIEDYPGSYIYDEYYINLNKEELVTFLLKYGDLFANRNLQEL